MASSQQTNRVEQVIDLQQLTPIGQVIQSHQMTPIGQMKPGQQVILVEVVKQKNPLAKYSSSVVYGLGVAQIALGVFSVALGVASIQIGSIFSNIGHGIWIGVLYVVAGAFGVFASKRKTSCTIATHFTLSIIAAMMAGIQMPLSIIAADVAATTFGNRHTYGSNDYAGVVAVDALLAVVAIIEGTLAIASSEVGCKFFCSKELSTTLMPTGYIVQGTMNYQQPAATTTGNGIEGTAMFYPLQPLLPVPDTAPYADDVVRQQEYRHQQQQQQPLAFEYISLGIYNGQGDSSARLC